MGLGELRDAQQAVREPGYLSSKALTMRKGVSLNLGGGAISGSGNPIDFLRCLPFFKLSYSCPTRAVHDRQNVNAASAADCA
jgi:hypothetical protein